MHNFVPNYGVGVGLRPKYYNEFLNSRPSGISWVEVISENFMRWKNGELPVRALNNLLKIRKNTPVVLHGVSMSLGSCDAVSLAYLKNLKELIEQVEPLWISDHLSWTAAHGISSHDLLPVPRTKESLQTFCDNLDRAQSFLQRPLLIENPSVYVEFEENEFSEADFFTSICQKSGCGILLDVNNLVVNKKNVGLDIEHYLKTIPLNRVGQIHLAGHQVLPDVCLDNHGENICDEVWRLYQKLVEDGLLACTMIERDSHLPEWLELRKELEIVHQIRSLKKEIELVATP